MVRPHGWPPDPRVTVAALRAFLAVARTGKVGAAAEVLGRAQPSVSARLAGLEKAWETRLFRRVARGMLLTPEGERLLPLAESALLRLEELDRSAGVAVASTGELRVGAGDALGREVLPSALAALLSERPRLAIHVREGPGPRLLDALREGDIDLALVVGAASGSRPEGLDVEPLIESAVELLVPRDAPQQRVDGSRVRENSVQFVRGGQQPYARIELVVHDAVGSVVRQTQ